MVQMHSNSREEIKEVLAGDIAAAIGLKDVTTGDTLCSATKPVVLERMEFPEPVISVAVEPRSQADQEKLGVALGKLAQEDPSFRVKTDEETGQTIISGMGELHLDIIVDRMRREFGVEANIGKPQVAYRERIKISLRLKASLFVSREAEGSTDMSALRFEPADDEAADKLDFHNAVVGGAVPKEYIPAVQKGVEEQSPERCVSGLSIAGSESNAVRRFFPRRRLQ